MEGYLRRIGLAGGPEAWGPVSAGDQWFTACDDRLRAIATAHLATVPFENLAVHGGEPAVVDSDAVYAKIVTRRRGGICYELNGGLGWLLSRLGWAVSFHGARVLGDDGPGLPLGHVALVTGVPDREDRWLVDVGFGGDLVFGPLARCVPELGVPAPAAAELAVNQPTGEPVSYLVESRPRPLTDFAGMAWWHSTSPGARFTRSLICSVTRGDVRQTLSGRRFKTTRADGVVAERVLTDGAEVLTVYREVFGIELDVEPTPRWRAGSS